MEEGEAAGEAAAGDAAVLERRDEHGEMTIQEEKRTASAPNEANPGAWLIFSPSLNPSR